MTYQVNYTPRCELKDIPIGGCFLAHCDTIYMRIGEVKGKRITCFRFAPDGETGAAWDGLEDNLVMPIKVFKNFEYHKGEYDIDPWDIPVGDCFITEDGAVFLQLTHWGVEGASRCFRLAPDPRFMIIRLPDTDNSDFNPIPKVKPVVVNIRWSP